MMSHIVKSCPLTKLNGCLSRLDTADEDAVVADQLWFMTRMREEEDGWTHIHTLALQYVLCLALAKSHLQYLCKSIKNP